TYECDFGGQGTSAAYSPTFAFPSGGTFNVRMIATGTNGLKDTLVRPVGIVGPVVVNSFSVVANNDTVCINGTSSIQVPASQNFVSYRLRNGFTPIGAAQSGNG